MKIILLGYPGSQRIVPASKYLTSEYLLGQFDIRYVNYKGPIAGWAAFVAEYLGKLKNKHIIFALDDYLMADYIDLPRYNKALDEIGGDIVCVKLCQSTPEEHEEYPVTTQYCIWDRKFLISILQQVNTPWEFEIAGSQLFRLTGKKSIHRPCLTYFANSSISGRWEGIRLDGLKPQDINLLKENGYI